jgi:hypothetical protein
MHIYIYTTLTQNIRSGNRANQIGFGSGLEFDQFDFLEKLDQINLDVDFV